MRRKGHWVHRSEVQTVTSAGGLERQEGPLLELWRCKVLSTPWSQASGFRLQASGIMREAGTILRIAQAIPFVPYLATGMGPEQRWAT